jgi:pimeloyl-ACP methyl ester carboxylesterase
MREHHHDRFDRTLKIQIPGLITGGFLQQLPVEENQREPATPHDLPTRTLIADGAELNYFEYGTGHPVVFVHGSFADYRAWFQQVEAFGARYRFVTYSRRCHYPNRWTTDGSESCTKQHGEDLAQLLSLLKLGPATLVGQSTGGMVALHAARNHPELVHSLVLSEPFCLPCLVDSEQGAAEWASYKEQFWTPAAELMARGDADGSIALLCDSIMGAGTYQSLPSEIRPIIAQNIPSVRLEFFNADFYSSFDRSDVEAIQSPTLIVEGDRSPKMFGTIADALASRIPDARRERFEDVCHVAPFFAPDAFLASVTKFIESLDAPMTGPDPRSN